MILANGNVTVYDTLSKASTETYLLTLEMHIEEILRIEKQLIEMKRKK